MISIIMPAYNCGKSIDRSIESVVRQTYTDIELLVTYRDGTDDTEERCRQWEKNDSRIHLIKCDQKGIGYARNVGVASAKGEYIAFVDSDDWAEPDFIERMFAKISGENLDMVECDYYAEFSDKTIIKGNGILRELLGEKGFRGYSSPALWKCMFRKSLWTDNDVECLNTRGEDFSIYSMLYALAGKTDHIREALYHYRMPEDKYVDWQQELSGIEQIIDVLRYIVEEHLRRGIFEQNYDILYQQAFMQSRYALDLVKKKFTEQEYGYTRGRLNECLMDLFKINRTMLSWKYVVAGSYNLGRSMRYLGYTFSPEEGRYSFSSIISMMSDRHEKVSALSASKYRENMLKKEFESLLLGEVDTGETDAITIDFLEERFDIIRSGDDYYTMSDAFTEAQTDLNVERIISRESDECRKLWEDACTMMMNRISEKSPRTRVILVEMYLSERFGSYGDTKEYENIEEIRRINKVLRSYYGFFKEKWSEIAVVPFEAYEGAYYTDDKFEYGCHPWHLNETAYILISNKLYQLLDGVIR